MRFPPNMLLDAVDPPAPGKQAQLPAQPDQAAADDPFEQVRLFADVMIRQGSSLKPRLEDEDGSQI